LHEEGLAIRREVGDRWAVANSLNNLGNVALDQGRYAEARTWQEEALALRREVGDRWAVANSLNNLGNVVRAQGDYAAARAFYRESLLTNRELGDRWGLAYLLEDMGGLAAWQSHAERAMRLIGAAAALRDEIRAPLSAAEQAKLERALEPIRLEMDETARSALHAEGRAMSLEQAIEYALSE
jgi:tetratricopeptide (TPR) repeat protein